MNRIRVAIVVVVVLLSSFISGCSSWNSTGQILDDNGNPLTVTPSPLPASVIQNVIADTHNSSNVPLNTGNTFTGAATSTLGIAGIQVSLKTDQNCRVYVDQSPDGTNWDINDTYNYIYSSGGDSWTVQAVNSWVRVRVTNVGLLNQTYFRLQTALCPIVEAVPRSLTSDGRVKSESSLIDSYGFNVEATPFNELKVAQSVKLNGAVFIGNTVDPNFIAVNTTGTGTVTQGGGMMTLSTGAGVDGYSEAFTQRRARFVAGNCNMVKLVMQMNDGVANNRRRWGIGDLPGGGNLTITDGAYFSENGSTFSIATMKGGVETLVSSGSFNGDYGSTYVLDNNVHVYEIYYSPYALYFSIDGELLHSIHATTITWSNTVTLYAGMDNSNYNGSTTNVVMNCWAFSIHRFGPLNSSPIIKHISTAGTYVLKYGAGTLHSVEINTSGASSSSVTIYDNTSAVAANTIAVISGPNNSIPFAMNYSLEFYTGLTVVTTGVYDVTVVYE